MTVAMISTANTHCNNLTFNFWPTKAPSGAAIKLAITIMTEGTSNIFPPNTFPEAAPIEERNVIASEEAMATRVGIFSITNMIGIVIKAPAAPTMPDNVPTIPAVLLAIGPEKMIFCESP